MIRVAIGSTNVAKVAAARALFGRLFPGAEVEPVAVASGVRPQPIGDDETRLGAKNRAVAARADLGADWGVGLEGGVRFEEGGCVLINWAAVCDGERVVLAAGASLPLPPAACAAVAAGEELGTVVDRLAGRAVSSGIGGAVGFLTRGALTRQTLWEAALACACAPFLRVDLYGGREGERPLPPRGAGRPGRPGA